MRDDLQKRPVIGVYIDLHQSNWIYMNADYPENASIWQSRSAQHQMFVTSGLLWGEEINYSGHSPAIVVRYISRRKPS